MSKILQKFTVYDLVIMAIMAAIGIAIKPIVVPIAHLISGPLMMPSGAFSGGLYMMWLVISYGIVRKPGTSTLTSLIQALIIFFTGVVGTHGIMTFFTYLAPGIAIDIVMLIIGHRVCCRGCAVLAGAVANMAGTASVNIVFFQTPGVYLILILSVSLLSGAIGGLIAWELIKILKKYKLINKFERKKKSFNSKTINDSELTESLDKETKI